jgi:hypothetical protein
MRKVRVELDMILEIDVDENDEELAEAEALTIARQRVLADCGNGKKYFEDEDVYMTNYGAMVLDSEEVDYANG